MRLNVVAVNAPPVRAAFRALRPDDVVRYPDPLGDPDRGDVLPASSAWPAFDARAARNTERTIEVPLRAKLGAPAGALAYGVAAHLGPERDFVASGVVQLTDLGVFAQWFPDGGRVSVARIADGSPVAGASVEVYPSQADAKQKSAPVACARASTDGEGVARFAGGGFAACAARDGGESQAPAFVTIVRKDADWTYVRTGESSGAYAGDFYNGWSSAAPLPRGTIFSDRELYQPGETAQMTAAGWFLVDGALRRGSAPSYTLTLELPGGRKRELGRRALDAFGLATFPVALPKDAPLGYYTVRASAGNGEQIVGDFRVAEFKPPNFKVDLALDREVAPRGGTVAGTAASAYLFGAPLAGAATKFTVTRSPADFTPKGRDAFAFGRRWFWPQEQPDAATDVLETTVTADAQGKSAVSVPVGTDLPYPMTYRVDAETTDASNVAVSDGKSFTALPADTLIGLATDGVGEAGTPLAVSAIATDAAGAARAGTKLHLELQAAKYASATQIVEGAEQPVESVSYETVASADATSAAAPVRVALTPPKPGTYRVRANVAGASDDAGETDVEVYVGGSGEPAWYARDPDQLTVKLDKTSYKVGDTARVLVQSPFPEAEIRFAVVRHGVLWETTQRTRSAAPTAQFTVTPDMLPNAAVQAFAVRRGPPPATRARRPRQRAGPGRLRLLRRRARRQVRRRERARRHAVARAGRAPDPHRPPRRCRAPPGAGRAHRDRRQRRRAAADRLPPAGPGEDGLRRAADLDALRRQPHRAGARDPGEADGEGLGLRRRPLRRRGRPARAPQILAAGLLRHAAQRRQRRRAGVVRPARRPHDLAHAGRRGDRRRPLRHHRRHDVPHHQAAGREPGDPAVRPPRRPLRSRRRGHQRHRHQRHRRERHEANGTSTGASATHERDEWTGTLHIEAALMARWRSS